MFVKQASMARAIVRAVAWKQHRFSSRCRHIGTQTAPSITDAGLIGSTKLFGSRSPSGCLHAKPLPASPLRHSGWCHARVVPKHFAGKVATTWIPFRSFPLL